MHGGDIYRNQVEIDYSVNINPLGVPESVEKALMEAVKKCSCYPDIRAEKLISAIAGMTGVEKEDLICGNGASEMFCAIVRAVMPSKVLIPVPSFYGYQKVSMACCEEMIFYKMKKEDGFCLTKEFLDKLTADVGMVFLANPNNPTGQCIQPELLEKILIKCRDYYIPVVLDECFIEFTGKGKEESYLRKIKEFPNLLVVRAFTKIFSIPGVRLGYLASSDEEMKQRIRKELPEWNLSVFAQEAGAAAVKEREYLDRTITTVRQEREYLTEKLEEMQIQVFPSDTNFLLLYTTYPLAEKILEEGILIRDCSNFEGLEEGYFRVAVKDRKNNEKLVHTIRQLMKKEGKEDGTFNDL